MAVGKLSNIERDQDWTIYFRDGSLIPPAVHPGHNRRDQVGWERMEAVRADVYRGALGALHEALQLARDFNRGAMTWQEYDRKLAALEAAHPREQ